MTIVVTGGGGNVGGELVRLLAAAGEKVVAVSRGPARLPDGVRHSPADLGEPASLKAAFDGADALFLLVAGQEPRAVLEAAEAGGIRRVVLLSSQGAGTRPGLYAHPVAFEEAVRASGLEWTILRPGGFHSNALAWAGTVRADRTAAAPFADVALPGIDPADIAEVAAATLREDGHAGRTYELTGPEPASPRQRAAAIGAALGAEVRFTEQTREEARADMLRFMPEPAVEGALAILGTPSAAELRVSPDVERVLGRAPRTFADWAARNVAMFR
ncbi:NAD(P)H-binding protein [Nonomuraea sp. NPDC050643]|uniref:SDR family oxidoreductase n=1 Tax=Nonomuraea sp. NPDC050643 TaxID=3155660 RepID=UPI0033E471F7